MSYEGYDKAMMNVAEIMFKEKPVVNYYSLDAQVDLQCAGLDVWMELVDALCAAAPPYMHEHFLNVCHTGKLVIT